MTILFVKENAIYRNGSIRMGYVICRLEMSGKMGEDGEELVFSQLEPYQEDEFKE